MARLSSVSFIIIVFFSFSAVFFFLRFFRYPLHVPFLPVFFDYLSYFTLFFDHVSIFVRSCFDFCPLFFSFFSLIFSSDFLCTPFFVRKSIYEVRTSCFFSLLFLLETQKHTQLLELHVVVEHLSEHNIAQSVMHKEAKHVRAVRQRKQADRVLARASTSSSICVQLAVFSKSTKKSKSAPPKKTTTTGVREGLAFIFLQS